MNEGPLLLHVPNMPEHVTYSWLAMAILIGLSLVARLTLKRSAPTGVQNLLETVVGGLENYVEEIMGPEGKH